jgi:hypothetical protein
LADFYPGKPEKLGSVKEPHQDDSYEKAPSKIISID